MAVLLLFSGAISFIPEVEARDLLPERIFRVEHLTTEDGLSQNTIDCIFKDSRGFIWFGTWNGLNRYDGYNFIVYKKEDQGNCISNNFIHSLCEDKQGNLWIATRNGLNCYVFKKERFTSYYHDSLINNSLNDNWVNVVYCDPKGGIWVGTSHGGVDHIDISPENGTLSFTHFKHIASDPLSLSNNDVRAITTDSRGRIWIGTADGLNLLEPNNNKFRIFRPDVQNFSGLSSGEIRCIYEDHSGFIWVGTQAGLNRWQEGSRSFVSYLHNPDDKTTLSHFVVNDIAEDVQHNLYIATLGGIDIFNDSRNSFDHISVNKKTDYSLNNEFINALLCDQSGIVWVGTDKGGVNKFNVNQKEFRFISNDPDNRNSLSNNTVNSIMDEPDILWIGTAGGGLNRYDKKSRKFQYYTSDSHRSDAISSDFITSIYRDQKGELWVGTWGMGFDRLLSTEGKGRFQHHRNIPGNPSSLLNNFISTLLVDKEANFWIGTEGGVELFRKETGEFVHICTSPSSPVQIKEVGCLLRDKSGNLWIGTRTGLFFIAGDQIDMLKEKGYPDKVICFRNDPENQESLSENYVISLFEDIQGQLWIGTFGNGLNKLVPGKISEENTKFKHYAQQNGLCNNVIYSILEDDNYTLWLSTDYGLSHFIPDQELFRNYYVSDGLRSNQFYWSAGCKGVDGKLYFGGMNGLNYFYPEEITNNKQPPLPVITDFKIFNQTVPVGKIIGNRVILNESISETTELYLNYRENTFSFEFSALSYDLPEKNRYAFKMDGVDDKWIEVSADRRFANYTKLKGGDYVFRLKAANNDGLWSENPASIHIIISPPFWLTIWFKIILVLFIITGLMVYLKLHTRSLKLQKLKLEGLVVERTAKIEQQKEVLQHQAQVLTEQNEQLARRQALIESQKVQMELQNKEIIGQRDKLIELNKKVKAVNQLKLKFFTNISHEFKTPLTLILGPLEKLIRSWKTDDDTKQMLNLINRNAERLLHLINQLMEFRKVEKGKMALHVTKGDIVEFIGNIFLSFQDLAMQQNVTLSVEGPKRQSEVWFDHEKLENILYNLLSNAFKYTPAEGKISITIRFFKEEPVEGSEPMTAEGSNPEWMELAVADSGIGIAADKLALIFKRFYRIENKNGNVQGSGIGLSLTKELVKTHHGTISVQSMPGKGSEFFVRIPCSSSHYSTEETSVDVYQSIGLERQVNLLKYELMVHSHKVRSLPSTQMARHKNSPLILIAEDNNDLREFLVSSLTKTYNVFDCDNGVSAYELSVQFNPDIIISDIMMSKMDGIELCTKIKENLTTSHIPVILLTSKGANESRIEGYKAGADEYISKPFSLELLETRIDNLIESRKKLRDIFNTAAIPDPVKITSNPTDQKFLNKAIQLVEENLDNSEFGVSEFATNMSVSRTLLHRKLTALTNQSASDFINTIRLKKSRELMISGEFNISEVAYAVGYNDPKYYSRIFRKYFGISPSDFLKESKAKVS
jgi:signal transduction histidine kinase/ligand-binding sensor domain-containing protein/DNA-binding response OmpR family regulator